MQRSLRLCRFQRGHDIKNEVQERFHVDTVGAGGRELMSAGASRLLKALEIEVLLCGLSTLSVLCGANVVSEHLLL